jgi:hypothetical protein
MDKLVREIFTNQEIFMVYTLFNPIQSFNQTLHVHGWSHPIHAYPTNQTQSYRLHCEHFQINLNVQKKFRSSCR